MGAFDDLIPSAAAPVAAPPAAPAGGGAFDDLVPAAPEFGFGQVARAFGRGAADLGSNIVRMGGQMVPGGLAPERVEPAAQAVQQMGPDFRPSATVQSIKDAEGFGNTAREVGAFVAEQGARSIPNMAGVMFPPTLPAIVGAETVRMAGERAKADERSPIVPSLKDLAIAAPTAAVTTALDRFGGRGVLGIGETAATKFGQVLPKAGGAVVKEAGTEAVQEGAEQVATTTGTKKGFNLDETLDAMLGGAIAGAGMGGGIRGTIETGNVLRAKLGARAGRATATDEEIGQAVADGDAEIVQILREAGATDEQIASMSESFRTRAAERVETRRVDDAVRPAPGTPPTEAPGKSAKDAAVRAGFRSDNEIQRQRDLQTQIEERVDQEVNSGLLDPNARDEEVARRVGRLPSAAATPDVIRVGPSGQGAPLEADGTLQDQARSTAEGMAQAGEVRRRVDRQAEEAFTLADRQRQQQAAQQPDTADTRQAGRPEGRAPQQVLTDQDFPVRILSERLERRGNRDVTVATVERYDPRTGQAEPDGQSYDVLKDTLRARSYSVDPRRAQEFEDEAQAPIVNEGKARGRRADEMQGLPRQTFRTTEPDPNEDFPAAGDGRSPIPPQGEGPSPFRPYSTAEEAMRDFEARQQRGREQGRASEEAAGEQRARERYAGAKFSNKPKDADASGRWQTDEDGFVVSDKGGPVVFGAQLQAGRWILKHGQNDPDQLYDIANHPVARGKFTVRARGRREPPGDGDRGGQSQRETARTEALPPPAQPNEPQARRQAPEEPRVVDERGGGAPQPPRALGGAEAESTPGAIERRGRGAQQSTAASDAQARMVAAFNDAVDAQNFARRNVEGYEAWSKVADLDEIEAHEFPDAKGEALKAWGEANGWEVVRDAASDTSRYYSFRKTTGLKDEFGEDVKIKVRVRASDHKNLSSQHDKPDINVAPGAFSSTVREAMKQLGNARIRDDVAADPDELASYGDEVFGEGLTYETAPPQVSAPEPSAKPAAAPSFDRPVRDGGEHVVRIRSEGGPAVAVRGPAKSKANATDWRVEWRDSDGKPSVLPTVGTLGQAKKLALQLFEHLKKSGDRAREAFMEFVRDTSGAGRTPSPEDLGRAAVAAGRAGGKLSKKVEDRLLASGDEMARLMRMARGGAKGDADGSGFWERVREGATKPADFGRMLFYANASYVKTLARRYAGEDGKPNAAITRLHDMFFAEPGTTRTVRSTYGEDVERRGRQFNNRLNKILVPFQPGKTFAGGELVRNADSEAALDALGRVMRGERYEGPAEFREAVMKASGELRPWLNDMHGYLSEAGVKVGFEKNYLPTEVNLGKALDDPTGFKKKAVEAFLAAGVKDRKNAAELADEWLRRVQFQDAGIVVANNDFVNLGTTGTGSKFERARVLNARAHRIMGDFLHQNPADLLPVYTLRAVRRAEWIRRMGTNLEGWAQLKNELTDTGAGEAIPDLVRAVQSMTDTMSNANRFRAFGGWLATWNALKHLPYATISSLSETFTPAMRSGNAGDAARTVWYTTKDLIDRTRGHKNDARALAEDLGFVSNITTDSLMSMRFGSEYQGELARHLSDRFFYRTGLHQFTEATAVASMRIGQIFLRRLAKEVSGKSSLFGPSGSASHFLRELGVDPAEAKAFSEWTLSKDDGFPSFDDMTGRGRNNPADRKFGKLYLDALWRFKSQSIVAPNAAVRPRYAQTAPGRVIYQLQSFLYGFHKNVLVRVAKSTYAGATTRELGTGRLGSGFGKGSEKIEGLEILDRFRLLLPLALLPMTALAQYALIGVRDALLEDPSRDPSKRIRTEQEKVLLAISRAGWLGARDPVFNLVSGVRYKRDPATVALGPSLGSISEFIGTSIQLFDPEGNSPNTNASERRTARMFYDVVVKPTLAAAGAVLPGGKVAAVLGAALIQTGAHPAVRERALVRPLAGPPAWEGSGPGRLGRAMRAPPFRPRLRLVPRQ